MHSIIAPVCQTGARDHGKNSRFASDRRVDLLGECQKVLGGVVNSGATELDLERPPSPVVAGHDCVDL